MKKQLKEEDYIPIYRGQKIDSDEYVEGNLGQYANGKYWISPKPNPLGITHKGGRHWDDIDLTTLSIHHPGMVASDSDRLLPNGEKDLRIFASLRKDGKGGDIVSIPDYLTKGFMSNETIPLDGTAIYYKAIFYLWDKKNNFNIKLKVALEEETENLKITSIQN